ncbi:hypothetical protein BDN72DRAFT_850873 [Pluteus cervinus]|uniref:Uncharacterized protein n=1 Tax=Pluteus cervinus TaxID=181527 RepID=A0ACD3A348_9AGAR|nr:hypothetical protein BDN72DRAFT_850873 [Pluteus cervinus]
MVLEGKGSRARVRIPGNHTLPLPKKQPPKRKGQVEEEAVEEEEEEEEEEEGRLRGPTLDNARDDLEPEVPPGPTDDEPEVEVPTNEQDIDALDHGIVQEMAELERVRKAAKRAKTVKPTRQAVAVHVEIPIAQKKTSRPGPNRHSLGFMGGLPEKRTIKQARGPDGGSYTNLPDIAGTRKRGRSDGGFKAPAERAKKQRV